MRFVVRVVATLLLGSLFLIPACAEDSANASSNSTTPEAPKPRPGPLSTARVEASSAGATSTAYLAPALPIFPPQAKASSSSSNSEVTPAVDLFAGYSYVRFNTKTPTASENFNWHGVDASLAANANRWLSLVADFGFYRMKDLPPNVSGSAYTFLFGPRLSVRGERLTPFVHVLFGAARLADVQATANSGSAFFNHSFSENAFAVAPGAGLDFNLNRHVGIRLFQAEYLLTKFHDGKDNSQNNLRASAGLVLHFGGGPPPPPPNRPPTVTVSADPAKVFAGAGDSVTLKAQASDPDNDTLNYKWSATGGGIEGSGPEVHWNPGGVKEGGYSVTVTVDDGRGGTANASTNITVEQKPNTPPTISCAANPATITVGQRATVTSTASDVDNDKLAYSYKASGGNVSGTGATAQFDSAGAAPGTYTITCHASDGRGGETDATTQVTVNAPQPAPEQRQLEQRLSLHSIYFPTAQPTEANPNGGLLASQQRTLVALAGDFKKYLAFKPDAHLILQGHADPRGGADYNKLLSDRRVARTKAFLVEQGVLADAIETQGLGVEQPMSADQVKQAVEQEQGLTPAQKAQLNRNASVLALAQNRRVDVTLSTTGQTSVRQFPFNAEDALNLLNPKGVGTKKAAPKTGAPKPAPKGAPKKGPSGKKQ